ncbi:MAG: hypothetical protein CMJ18_02100 [Phycisphaeraceae bacterium]|nr:hypothetical protein [Phycisphaeraceae bacterium]
MNAARHRVAIIGCGRQGQRYAEAYLAYPDTQIVALVEPNAARRRVVAERFGVKAHYPDVPSMLNGVVPDVAAVVTPARYTKDAVIACAEAGVRGVSTEKPIGGVLADADEMVTACAERGVVFSGGCLQSAMHEVQEVAARLGRGDYGQLSGAAIHGFSGEIVGGCCQHICVLRLLMHADIDRVTAWGGPPESLQGDTDGDLNLPGWWRLTNGVVCAVFGTNSMSRGVEVWNDQALVRWDWGPPQVFRGLDGTGARVPIDPHYETYPFSEFGYMTGAIRSLLRAIETGSDPWVTGHDLRQALEVAIAARQSALLGQAEIRLPLEDRTLRLYPTPYRWSGGDASGAPQPIEEAASGRRA